MHGSILEFARLLLIFNFYQIKYKIEIYSFGWKLKTLFVVLNAVKIRIIRIFVHVFLLPETPFILRWLTGLICERGLIWTFNIYWLYIFFKFWHFSKLCNLLFGKSISPFSTKIREKDIKFERSNIENELLGHPNNRQINRLSDIGLQESRKRFRALCIEFRQKL